jgi:hypothetical protein
MIRCGGHQAIVLAMVAKYQSDNRLARTWQISLSPVDGLQYLTDMQKDWDDILVLY